MRKPKLTKEEKEQLKKAEHESYFKAKLEQAKGKWRYDPTQSKPSTIKKIGKFMQKISANARRNVEQLEKEQG